MAIVYEWKIEQMNCYPEYEGNSDVVFNVHWRLNASQDEYHATSYGSIGIQLNPDEPFTPYDQLTQDQVIGWVKGAMGEYNVAQTEEALDKQIQNQITPPIVNLPLPWATEQVA